LGAGSFLEAPDKLADRRGGHKECARRRRKSAKLDNPHKDFHLAGAVYVQSRHCDFIS
jgi:hypothetical protein